MLIRVMYNDGRFDMVRNDMLDRMLANMKIKKIRRASGWIDVARDPVRQSLGLPRAGRERRTSFTTH